jgi:transcription termination factor Rho
MNVSLSSLLAQRPEELTALAQRVGVKTPRHPWRDVLATNIAQHAQATQRPERTDEPDYGCGVLEVHAEGFGFLRSLESDLLPAAGDIYVSQSQIRRFRLRTGDVVIGRTRAPKEGERYPALLRVEAVHGEPPDAAVTPFGEHRAVHPTTRLPLQRDPWLTPLDRLAPLGLGARGLLLGSARAQRGEVLRRFATALGGDPDLQVTVLAIGERPEEITDWREASAASGFEVLATPFDEPAQRHVHVADIVFERARRMAERGQEVVLLVDSLPRLLRFVIADLSTTGRTLDGVDAGALHRLRTWFASARDLAEAGSVTLIGTCNDDPHDLIAHAIRRDLGEVCTWTATLADPATPGLSAPTTAPTWAPAGCWTLRDDKLVPGAELARRRTLRTRLGDHATADDIEAAWAALV